MSHKKKKYKDGICFPAPRAMRVAAAPDFDEFERQAERRAARHEELRYRIGPDCRVHIQFNGIATQEALRKLMNYIEMGISDFPKTADNLPRQD